MMSIRKALGVVGVGAVFAVAGAAYGVPAGAAAKSGQDQFVKQATAICKTADTKVETASNKLDGITSSGLSQSQEVKVLSTQLSNMSSALDDGAAKLKKLKTPKGDSTDFEKGIAQIRAIASLTTGYAHALPALIKNPTQEEARLNSFKSSAKKDSEQGSKDFAAIGLTTCATGDQGSTSLLGGGSTSGTTTSPSSSTSSRTSSTTYGTSSTPYGTTSATAATHSKAHTYTGSTTT